MRMKEELEEDGGGEMKSVRFQIKFFSNFRLRRKGALEYVFPMEGDIWLPPAPQQAVRQ